MLESRPRNVTGVGLFLFFGFVEGWLFTAVIKNKFWACDYSCNYLVSKVKSCSENNNTMLAKPLICDKPEVVFIL